MDNYISSNQATTNKKRITSVSRQDLKNNSGKYINVTQKLVVKYATI